MRNTNTAEAWVKRSLAAVWHPCTQMKQHELFPLVAITHGKGPWLFDANNNAILDAISSWWTNLFGHANVHINQAIHAQLEKIEHVMLAGFTHPPVVELSEKLSALTGGHLGHAFYASDGASAVEIALKMSHHFWRITGQPKKRQFVCLANSYHGETLGALAVTDVAIFRQAYGDLLQTVHTVMSPDLRQALPGETPAELTQRAASDVAQLFAREHANIAAFIIEPLVQCAGQMAMHDATYLQLVRELCDRYSIHLIADEIAVGCGRTGHFFACEQAGIWPDFLTLSKGISGGYLPLSLSLTHEQIYQAFYRDDVRQGFLHSHSYTGNPLACAAALASLEIFSSEQVLEKNIDRALELNRAFAWAKADERIEHFRQQGMILAFDVKNTALHAASLTASFGPQLFQQGLQAGVLVRPIGNTVYVMPPYILSAAETQMMSEKICSAYEKTLDGRKSS
ncbi:BioA Adenosylmethionine-8-amino-7-oxononanoate aminotransferase [Burkholderiaceae bacterium]|jgi:adenosylmethionine-8-amino-7-oxononanoate aminotransferase